MKARLFMEVFVISELRNKRLKRIKEIVARNDRMSECVQELVKEDLVVSMSEGRRLYTQMKDVIDNEEN